MSEAKLSTYIVAYDADEYVYPVAATLTKKRADELVEIIAEKLVEEGERRWRAAYEDDSEVRPYDPDAVRVEAKQRFSLTGWDVPFVESEGEVDPHVIRLAIEMVDDHEEGELFEP